MFQRLIRQVEAAGRCIARSVIAMAVLGLGGCTTNPATGERFLNLLTPEEEIQIGAQAAPDLIREFGGAVEHPQLQAYVRRVGMRLAEQTEAYFPTLPWEFTLLNSPEINAFALPGGKVFITRGLMERLENEAQLAGVLGHEVGHVSAQHGARRIGQQIVFEAGLAIAGAVVDASGKQTRRAGEAVLPAVELGGTLVLLKFGRDEEHQADALGVRYMVRAGYDPSAQVRVMEILRDAAGGAQPELLGWLSTHPLPDQRIRRLRQLVESEYAYTRGDPAYGLYAERFRAEMLEPLRRLPPPPTLPRQ